MTIATVRRMAVACQRLSGPTPAPVTTEVIVDLVRAIGCLQLDPTAIVARNHLLVLFSRLGVFDPKLVDTLLWDQRLLYEYWAHQASIVPTADRALHAALPPRSGDAHQTEQWLSRHADKVDLVLERLRGNASVRASDFEEHTEKYQSGWGARSRIADSLGLLWLLGQIVPAGRDGGGRRWAMADRWFGAPVADVPSPHEAVRRAATRSLRMLGIATKQQVRKHFLRRRYAGLDGIWQDLEREGLIVPVDPGLRGAWFVHVDDLRLLDRIEAGEFEPRTTFLSPFDNLICDRDRTLAIWSFDFRLEIYVPKSDRWGYFVMPLLHGDQVIARFDLAVRRDPRRLEVVGERWEPGWSGRRRPLLPVRRALRDLSRFVGASPTAPPQPRLLRTTAKWGPEPSQ